MKKEDAPHLKDVKGIAKKKVVQLIEDMRKLREAKKDLEAKEAQYKLELGAALTAGDVEGFQVDDVVVCWQTKTTKTLHRDKLIQLGVSVKLIDKATTETESKPFISVSFPRATGDGEDA